MIEIPYSMEYGFDKNLHEVPLDKKDMENGVFWLKEKIKTDQSMENRIFCFGLIGIYQRILGFFDEAEEYLIMAFDAEKEPKNALTMKLRLATVYQWQNKFDEALLLFDECMQNCGQPSLYEMKDFVLQHKGKCYFDMEQYSQALVCFEESLNIRKEKAQEDLIVSTEYAIKETRKRMKSA